ncbi:transglutaminase domain-containing protein [Modestobacter sp. I12A-02628]|uniref:Transglutaminase domain-containing protein n=1 Tax=Goekera deserti TaxID=2497753 RepID=A0A7K3WAE7_9ACTN|nr:transglutaminase domain-containing protein [Goekera deserti]NDI47621.1 transglutaminase domain-containing protein [Goekera deserti]NDI47684.1 transglutaminase domain-containing protein [Goekera deserti]NEL53432.1 transglutaminase domain-containing protein [Goekera deserti]
MNGRSTTPGVAAGVATALGSLAFSPVFAVADWVPPVVGAVVVVTVVGLLLRTTLPWAVDSLGPGRDPGGTTLGSAVVPLVQLAVLFAYLTWVFAPQHTAWGLPTPTSAADLFAVFGSGGEQLREQATPALPLDGLVALTTVAVGLVALAVDLVAAGARQPALGGIGLLVLYCVPVSTVVGDVGVLTFLGPAAGFAVLLWADQRTRLAGRLRSGPGAPLGAGTLTALRTGAVALVAGLLLPLAVPTLAEGQLAKGLGNSTGSGGTGTSLDPFAELQGELSLPQPIPLLSVAPSVDDPPYLRAVTLDVYGDRGWRMGALDEDEPAVSDEPLAPLPAGSSGREVDATVTVLQHDDRFLPVPGSPLSVRIDEDEDDWYLDTGTSTVFGEDVTTGGRTYEVTAAEPRPSEAQLEASPGEYDQDVAERYLALPELPPRVTDLAVRLTAGAQTPYDRVRAISDYLTDRANGFTYSLTTAAGTTGDALLDFLDAKQGYCEQYAGAMAVLVRAAGVPARVVLGYTTGMLQTDGSRTITSDDAHAWVEVWFPGVGWVTFDPTPISAGRAVELPWAPRADAPVQPQPGTPEALPAPTAAPAPPTAEIDEDDQFVPVAVAPQDSAVPWRSLLLGTGGVALLAGLLAAPGVARAGQRRRRVADGGPSALWDELMATAEDLGVLVPDTRTPRQTARQLAELVAPLEPDAVAAVRALAVAEEGSSYGRPGSAVVGPVDALGTARRGLLRATSRSERVRALLWPVSTMRGLAATVTGWARRRPGRTRPA